jgi:ribosome-associated protein
MSNQEETELLLRTCCLALDDKKAEEVRILKLPENCSIADYFIIASGSSQPHLKALHRSLETALKEIGASILGKERYRPSGWMVIDVFDVVVHVFSREAREFYALEELWKDSESLDLRDFLPEGKAVAG